MTTGDIINVTDSGQKIRGGGAIHFDQADEPNLDDEHVFVDMLGEQITANNPDKLPRQAFTVAAWVNVQETMTPREQSIFQARSGGTAFVTHFQLQDNGQMRLRLRGQDRPPNPSLPDQPGERPQSHHGAADAAVDAARRCALAPPGRP